MGIIVIFEEEAQPEQMGEARAAPSLTAPAQALLELFAQGLGRPAAPRGPGFRHGLVVQVVAVALKVTHLAFEFELLGRRARGGGRILRRRPRLHAPSRAPASQPCGGRISTLRLTRGGRPSW